MEESAGQTVAEDMQADADANVAGEEIVRCNDSGIIPCEFKVLVLPDESEVAIRARRINFVVPPGVGEGYAHGTVTGRIIAISEGAFSYHDWSPVARLPQVGERVVYARYAGMIVKGRPKRDENGNEEQLEYRLLNDKDVAGILEF